MDLIILGIQTMQKKEALIKGDWMLISLLAKKVFKNKQAGRILRYDLFRNKLLHKSLRTSGLKIAF